MITKPHFLKGTNPVYRIYYQPEGVWFGDCMPFFANGQFYLYHQRDTRNPEPFAEPFGWALATTKDFVNYQDHGEVLPRGSDQEQDQFIFAGSIFAAEGKYYAITAITLCLEKHHRC